MSPRHSLHFCFPLQIEHTEVDTTESRQNGRPATNLPAPKSAVSPHLHVHALVYSLPGFKKEEVVPASVSFLPKYLAPCLSEAVPKASQ